MVIKQAPQRLPELAKLSSTALNAFFNISHKWQLRTEDEMCLLGMPSRSTFFKWKKTREGKLGKDTLERISYILGIYKALHILIPDPTAADTWLRRNNSAPLFGGITALDKMLGGNVVDLADVRRYLDAERG